MSTLSAGQLVDLRTKKQTSSFKLSILKPVALLTALVNNVAIARGARTIAFDTGTGSGFATIEAGQTLIVTTADGLQRVRVKSISGSQASGSIVVAENSISWADNQAFSIYHLYDIWPIPLTIRGGVFFKDYDLAYSTQNLTPNPVAIIGSHRTGTLVAGTIDFSLNSSSSYAIASGATISSRVWSCVHMGGGTSGISFSSTTAANPTLTITEAGQYWLKCIVTDSNSKTQATYRAIFVYDSATLPYTSFTASGLSGDWQTGGYRFNIEATGDIELSDFPDRTLVVLWYDNTFNGIAGYVDLWGTASQNIVCAGYLRRDQDNDDFSNGTGSVSFEVTTPDGILDATAILGSVSLEAVAASPTTWYEYASWLTVGRSVHHLLKWHSTVLETCDVYGLTANTLGVKATPYTEASLLQMINSFAMQRGHFAKMVSDRLGRLHFVTDSQMLNDAGRAALDTVFSIVEADISGVVDVVRQEEEQVTITDLDGFSFVSPTSTPFISMQPGYRESSISYNMPEMRGAGGASFRNQVLIDQTDANEKVGRAHCAANRNPFEMRHTTPANYLGAFDIVPSIGWYEWGLADADLKRNTALTGIKLICRHVDHAIDHAAGTIQTSIVFEPEAQGPDGIQGNYPVGYPTPVLRVPQASTGDQLITTATEAIITYYSETDNLVYTRLVTLDPLALSAEVLFTGPAQEGGILTALSSTKVLCIWSNDTTVHATVLTASGGTVVVGADNTLFDAGVSVAVERSGLTAITSTTALLVFDNFDTGTHTAAVMLTISGDTVTYGTIEIIDNSQPVGITASRLSATKAIAAWFDATGGTDLGYYNILAINGADVNAGTSAQFASGLIRSPGVTALSSSVAVVFYGRSGGSYHPTVKPIYAITGQTGSLGNENVLDATDVLQDLDFISHHRNVRISTSKSVVGYKETVDDEQYIVATRYGDTVGGLAAGALLKIDDNGGVAYTYPDYPGVSAVSPYKVVVFYLTEGGTGIPTGKIFTATVASDLTITNDGNEITISADVISLFDIAALRAVV